MYTNHEQLKHDYMFDITEFHTEHPYLMHDFMTELMHECMIESTNKLITHI